MENNENIRTLTQIEHIRRRPVMYIGKLGDGSCCEDGMYIMLKEILDSSVKASLNGGGNQISVNLEGNHLSLRSFTHGIPFQEIERTILGKYSRGMYVFKWRPPLEYAIICALSSEMLIESYCYGQMKRILTSCGEITTNEVPIETNEPDGVFISFLPDKSIFGDYNYNADIIRHILYIYSVCNSELRFIFGDEVFYNQKGMLDLPANQKVDIDLQNL